jgi:hypothetical protein
MADREDIKPPLLANECCQPAGATVCCGGGGALTVYPKNGAWVLGDQSTSAGSVPWIVTRLTWRDRLEHWKVRWGIGRMRFAIAPGLYAAGNPDSDSPVFVSANYKMSFDYLRAALDGLDGWILVLDTKGINVWCAAGKGTFGTEEIVRRIATTRLPEIVNHRKLIVPQLGAPGVAAHEVKSLSGFTVRYGPVRAGDIQAFLMNSLKATPEMRRVHFSLRDRLSLVPVEIVQSGIWGLLIVAVLGLLAGFGVGIYSVERALFHGVRAATPVLGGMLAGAIFTPWFLPWLPGRAFASKGAWAGAIWLILLGLIVLLNPDLTPGWADFAAWLLLIPSIASFVGMNFTGCSTYTSLSGVRKEMRIAVPLQVGAMITGLGFWIAGRFA